MKALLIACEEMPARAPALPGCPPPEQDLGRVNAFSPWSRWKGGLGWGTVDGNDKETAGREAFRSAGILARTSPIHSHASLSPATTTA